MFYQNRKEFRNLKAQLKHRLSVYREAHNEEGIRNIKETLKDFKIANHLCCFNEDPFGDVGHQNHTHCCKCGKRKNTKNITDY